MITIIAPDGTQIPLQRNSAIVRASKLLAAIQPSDDEFDDEIVVELPDEVRHLEAVVAIVRFLVAFCESPRDPSHADFVRGLDRAGLHTLTVLKNFFDV